MHPLPSNHCYPIPLNMPIRPDEIPRKKAQEIPSIVLEAVDALLVREFTGTVAVIDQDALVEEIMRRAEEQAYCVIDEEDGSPRPLRRNDIFTYNWLDFEPIYEEHGWRCWYNKQHAWAGDKEPSHFRFIPKTPK